MTDKKIVKYTSAIFHGDPTGTSVYIRTTNHPDFSAQEQSLYGLTTSTVQSYDETTGIIETMNTVYVPLGPEDAKSQA